MLDSAFKKIVKHLYPRGKDTKLDGVHISVFGKHPGWDDHVVDVGNETDTLISVKRMLYVQGVGGNVDSGRWKELQQDQRIEDFDNVFLWWLDNSLIAGRMWSSQDGKGRKSYPMIVCAQCCNLPFQWVVDNVLPRLEKCHQDCVGSASGDQVSQIVKELQNYLSQAAKDVDKKNYSEPDANESLAEISKYPEMGLEHEGLLRILYHIEREIIQHDELSGRNVRSTLLRVPAVPADINRRMALWNAFLRDKLGPDAPLLMVSHDGCKWMDIIIGEPGEGHLFCLRATELAVPLTNSIPYNMGQQFKEKFSLLFKQLNEAKGAESKILFEK